MMNVVFLLEHYLPMKIGGKQTYVQTLGQELSKNGHQVAVCTLGDTHQNYPKEKNDIRLYRIEGFFQRMSFLFKYKGLKSHPPIYDGLISRSLDKIFEREKPDVIHCHDWMLFSSLGRRLPVILTLHDYGFICTKAILTKNGQMCGTPFTRSCIGCGKEVYGAAKSLGIYSALKINRLQLSGVRKYIAICDFQRDVYCRSLNIPARDIAVIPNSVNTGFFAPQKEAQVFRERNAHTQKSGSKRIVLVGRLSWDRMNVVTSVVKAVPKIEKEYPNTTVLIVGWSERGESLNLVNQIVKRANKELSRSKIQIILAPSQTELLKIYSSADVVIGAGRVALEGMACAKPVIVAGDTIGPLGGNFGGPVTPNAVKALRSHNFTGRNSAEKTTPSRVMEECVKLLGDQRYSEQLGDFGRKYVEREHDIEKKAKDIVRLYQESLT